MGYDIRWATSSDLPELLRFFRRAYGAATVFQDARFVGWFLGARTAEGSDEPYPLESVVAIAADGEIVAHYGALRASLALDAGPVPIRWGVNAYTLPGHRGRGLGRAVLEPFKQLDGVLGVIGFKPAVRDFYATAGFNVFGAVRAHRHVLCLDPRVSEVSALVGGDASRVARLLPIQAPPLDVGRPVRLGLEHLTRLELRAPGGLRAHCQRTPEWLRWRFLDNPSLAYDVRCCERDGATTAYVAYRRLVLEPTEHTATRIVDVMGSAPEAEELVRSAAAHAAQRGDLYVEYIHFGRCCEHVFERLGFETLREDDVELLPLVTSPVERRTYNEYLGLYSATHTEAIANLTEDQVHFTLADSDRDRAARIHDLPRPVSGRE